ncbi:disease resistance protein RPV1-like [Rutidosis leptorrhynchoides]|uniref:disease resistance protein RPV1-like n=1 Tax=Rutidosis leptorrhynchoides TaxID=125765 RepID=UPI003A98DCA0
MISYASSSSSILRQSYDVFMSFHGDDTRMGFTSHLYDALTRKHIKTYKDDKSLEIGNYIAPDLLEAIETSRFAVVVLSTNYATSKWCLEEIAKVVDCKEQGKLVVIPVFYHVSPSDVRHQSISFEQCFIRYEEDPEISPQKVATWRSALAKVGSIKGLHVTPHRSESKIVSEIIRRILQCMQDALPVNVTKGLVGIESLLNDVIKILTLESSDVRFIGICGMSGIGKTTLAEVVFESIWNKFEESSFIENIKDVSRDHCSDLCKLQHKILDDVLKDDSITIRNVKHGQTLLKTKLRNLKVMIVLDDLNHTDQLTYLAGEHEWFGPGSRIIVTTTNIDLLNPFEINEIFMCEELEGVEAHKLFCQSAFGKERATHGYEAFSHDIVKFAGGLPLALNVYGSLLCGKEEKYWKEILKKVQEYPHKQVLEISYARLDGDQQHTFMYIACFLKGMDVNLVKDMLSNIGLYPECGITDLVNKFLITINHDDCLWMHDLLQQMCWEILHKESQRFGGKQIAIKYHKDVVDILLSKPQDLPNLRYINLAFSKDLTKIPDLTSAQNLVKLNLEGCSKLNKLHKSVLLLKKLRYLNLNGCTTLQSLGRSNMEMEALVTLLLSGYSTLEYIPNFGQNMKCIEHL